MNLKALLNTPMNELGLGGVFNSWFFRPKKMTQDQVITLKEFIALNPFMKVNGERFTCWRNDEVNNYISHGFAKESASWIKLKDFLIMKGFTYQEWVMLLPNIKTDKGHVPDYKLLGKKILVEMPVCKITDVKPNCYPFRQISNATFGNERNHNDPFQLKVKDILCWTAAKINTEFPLSERNRSVRHTFLSIQARLRQLGFGEKDSVFMKAYLFSLRTREDHIANLVQNKGFSRPEAVKAVALGIKAGWIHAESNKSEVFEISIVNENPKIIVSK